MRSPRTAMACAVGWEGFMVAIFPLRRTRSAGWAERVAAANTAAAITDARMRSRIRYSHRGASNRREKPIRGFYAPRNLAEWADMARVLPFLLLATLLSAATPPKLRLSEVQDIIPERYRADLTLDPDRDQFSGSIQIAVRRRRPAQTIWLNANQIAVQQASVVIAGKARTAVVQAEGNDFLALQLDTPLPAGPAEIRIRYTGKV